MFPQLSVLENVRLAVEASRGGAMRIWRRASSLGEEIERARGRSRGSGSRPGRGAAGSLPHGDKRKLELAMLLAADKQVILLDEPMAGVSAGDVPASST